MSRRRVVASPDPAGRIATTDHRAEMRIAVLCAGLAGLAVVLHGLGIRAALDEADDPLRHLVVLHSLLPRAMVALAAGAALGLAGMLLQRVLRNPLADASTLGVAAGAHLALVAAMALLPDLAGFGREAVALAGALAAAGLVLGLTSRQAFEPATVVVAGMLVGLVCASATAALILFSGQYMTALFLWGGGSLAQQDWGPAQALGIRLAVIWPLAALLLRPLALLGLDDAGAGSLGLPVARMRIAVLLLAMVLAGSVVAQVGVIGFIGLAAPNIARMLGLRTPRALLLAAPLLGALTLLLTDGIVQAIDRASRFALPTGAVTALLAGPFLLLLLPRLPGLRPVASGTGFTPPGLVRPGRRLALLAGILALLVLAGLTLGRDGAGLILAGPSDLAVLLPWRLPRLAAEMAGGAMLAAAGCVLQRMTANPLASPEVLGVSGAASLGLAICILAAPAAGLPAQIGSAGLGAGLGLAALLAVARRAALHGGRMLLGGIALGALSGAGLTVIMTRGGMEAAMILAWITGASAQVDPTLALLAVAGAVAGVATLGLLARWLDVLPLGDSAALALGLPLARAKLIILTVAALTTGLSALTIGPVSFVGLMAPHLARSAGFVRARVHLAGSVAIGCGLMAAADLLSRLVFYPYQMPVGLFASLIGAPYLIRAVLRAESTRC
ncbi:iron complex transport system permease protein [Methylobacterium sp. ap11]|uniref:Fe(3+)-hydroxamate ABC transporter permease FhuB n=1 Tax=Methylobacterium sp. ap11 TaxID=1761799 RepID=UPI0008C21A74|nr:Fe(3+)-hydroxamate ABC transporter permease FhuB [Methylobacterium sp. ap11]SEP41627.1 iron complex transport system permease protein [Methylobacterium sp. ap11]